MLGLSLPAHLEKEKMKREKKEAGSDETKGEFPSEPRYFGDHPNVRRHSRAGNVVVA
jgi:hypothetical protein